VELLGEQRENPHARSQKPEARRRTWLLNKGGEDQIRKARVAAALARGAELRGRGAGGARGRRREESAGGGPGESFGFSLLALCVSLFAPDFCPERPSPRLRPSKLFPLRSKRRQLSVAVPATGSHSRGGGWGVLRCERASKVFLLVFPMALPPSALPLPRSCVARLCP